MSMLLIINACGVKKLSVGMGNVILIMLGVIEGQTEFRAAKQSM